MMFDMFCKKGWSLSVQGSETVKTMAHGLLIGSGAASLLVLQYTKIENVDVIIIIIICGSELNKVGPEKAKLR